jgi:hypothetical protein
VRTKPELQWRPQDDGVNRKVELLLRRAVDIKWSQPGSENLRRWCLHTEIRALGCAFEGDVVPIPSRLSDSCPP